MTKPHTESQLPIVQVTYQLSLDLRRTIAKFPRAHRNSLGDFLSQGLGAFLETIVRTNHLTDHSERVRSLRVLMGQLLSIRLHLRMAKDLGCLSKGQFADFSRKLDDIQRQLIGWHKWAKTQLAPSPHP
jgi:hypothetical protein